MEKRGKIGLLALVVVLVIAGLAGTYFAGVRPVAQTPVAAAAAPSGIPQVPEPGMVTMLDLGATGCVPCKMMIPVIEDMRKEYAGRAAVLFIDVWENPEQGRRFGIQGIPTQIFYDAAGREVGRHVGYLDRESIRATFAKLGVK